MPLPCVAVSSKWKRLGIATWPRLPDPQEDHAVIMTKFASDCLFKMGQLTMELAHVMGADTAKLAL
jgi:hypothetical protein